MNYSVMFGNESADSENMMIDQISGLTEDPFFDVPENLPVNSGAWLPGSYRSGIGPDHVGSSRMPQPYDQQQTSFELPERFSSEPADVVADLGNMHDHITSTPSGFNPDFDSHTESSDFISSLQSTARTSNTSYSSSPSTRPSVGKTSTGISATRHTKERGSGRITKQRIKTTGRTSAILHGASQRRCGPFLSPGRNLR